VLGFLHPEGVFDDPKGKALRRELYRRLKYHFQFQNALLLFPIGDRAKFSINIYSGNREPSFESISGLVSPRTIEGSTDGSHDVELEGVKNEYGKWNLKPSSRRVVFVDRKALEIFANVYDDSDDWEAARLPSLFSSELLPSLRKLSTAGRKLAAIKGKFYSSLMWSETNSLKIDKTIAKQTHFPENPESFMVSGPHFGPANPIYQTPQRVCSSHQAYDCISLENIPKDFLPRANFVFKQSGPDRLSKIAYLPWNKQLRHVEVSRVFARKRIDFSHERTLKAAVYPAGFHHINSCISFSFEDTAELLAFAAGVSSLPFDFFVKSTGKADFLEDLAAKLPLPVLSDDLAARVLTLNCLTSHYSELWSECWQDTFRQVQWSKPFDQRLTHSFFNKLSRTWSESSALRRDYERRQAMLEIDVLIAKSIGITLNELIAMYRMQFPVMQQYERDTWYDQHGRIVFTASKGLTGVGFPRKGSGRGANKTTGWEDIQDMTSGTVSRTITDDTLPGGPIERTITYEAPFDRCDRVEDYKTAWAFFEKEGTGA
jgi:hypothetical protein